MEDYQSGENYHYDNSDDDDDDEDDDEDDDDMDKSGYSWNVPLTRDLRIITQ